jgi:hypothetical protein
MGPYGRQSNSHRRPWPSSRARSSRLLTVDKLKEWLPWVAFAALARTPFYVATRHARHDPAANNVTDTHVASVSFASRGFHLCAKNPRENTARM